MCVLKLYHSMVHALHSPDAMLCATGYGTERAVLSTMTSCTLHGACTGQPWLQCCVLQVVEQNGQYYSEYDGKLYPSMVRRYAALMKVIDSTAEDSVNAFNEQVRFALKFLK